MKHSSDVVLQQNAFLTLSVSWNIDTMFPSGVNIKPHQFCTSEMDRTLRVSARNNLSLVLYHTVFVET